MQLQHIIKLQTNYTVMSLMDYVVMGKLGQGSFGVVQKVVHIDTNQQYALKTVALGQLKQKNKINAYNEISLLSTISHPNIIGYKQSFMDEENNSLYTVLELASNGDLADRIKWKQQNYQEFKESQIWAIGRDIVNGLAALHDRNIAHRDIKPANILFCQDDLAKIGDFNASTKIVGCSVINQIGTPYYASPEIWNNQPYSFDCDIWSFGCVLYEMCTLRKPFQGRCLDRIYRKVMTNKYKPIPYHYSYNLLNVIERCLTTKDKRINAQDLKRIFEFQTTPLKTKIDNIRSCANLSKIPYRDYSNYRNPEDQDDKQPEETLENSKPILDNFLKPERRLTTQTPPYTNVNINTRSSQRVISNHKYSIPQSSRRISQAYYSPLKPSIIEQLESAQRYLRTRQTNYLSGCYY